MNIFLIATITTLFVVSIVARFCKSSYFSKNQEKVIYSPFSVAQILQQIVEKNRYNIALNIIPDRENESATEGVTYLHRDRLYSHYLIDLAISAKILHSTHTKRNLFSLENGNAALNFFSSLSANIGILLAIYGIYRDSNSLMQIALALIGAGAAILLIALILNRIDSRNIINFIDSSYTLDEYERKTIAGFYFWEDIGDIANLSGIFIWTLKFLDVRSILPRRSQ